MRGRATQRRALACVVALVSVLATVVPANAAVHSRTHATARSPQPRAHARSLARARAGLRPGTGPCAGLYEFRSSKPTDSARTCTHGPDVVDRRDSLSRPRAVPAFLTPAAIPCYRTGPFVHVLYLYRSTNYLDAAGNARRPLIREAIAYADQLFLVSAAQQRSLRRVRWKMSSSCALVITPVHINTDMDLFAMRARLVRSHILSTSEKGLSFIEGDNPGPCWGIGELMPDDRSSTRTNRNNKGGMLARIERGCWGDGSETFGLTVPPHELLHTLGAVQASAPHATHYGHCFDESDVMCYRDGPRTRLRHVCATTEPEYLDCHRDDYFSTRPRSGTYIARHWNTARSAWLGTSAPPRLDLLVRPHPTITEPAEGSSVSGIMTVAASVAVADGASNAGVVFSINGSVVGTDTTAPYTVDIDTRASRAGSASRYPTGLPIAITATAIDRYWRVGKTSVTVWVANPTIHLVSPATDAIVTGFVPWSAEAQAGPGRTVRAVQLLVNEEPLGTPDSEAPYAGTWDARGVSPGTFAVRARVTDSEGATRDTPQRIVIVSAPVVRLQSPALEYQGAPLPVVFGPMLLAADAHAVGELSIDHVDFLVNGLVVGSDTTSPFGVPYDATTPGTVTVRARAVDADGGSATADQQMVIRDTGNSIALTAPSSGDEISGSSVAAAIPAIAAGMTVQRVIFLLDGRSLGSDYSPPYSIPWDSTRYPNGPHVVSAQVVWDDHGTRGAIGSAGTPISIANSWGAIHVSTPTQGAAVRGDVTIAAATQVPSQLQVDRVTFWVNGAVVDVDYEAPFSATWSTRYFADGSYTVRAQMSVYNETAYAYGSVDAEPVVVSVANLFARVSAPTGGSVSGRVPLAAVTGVGEETDVDVVRFLVDGVVVSGDTTAPYTGSWDSTGHNGPHTIVARATASDGRSVDSAPVSVSVP